MTAHFNFNYECPGCGASYIPYDNIPCPKCGSVETKKADYMIKEIASAAEYHKSKGYGMGKYTPMAYAIKTFGDHIAHQCFQILDNIENANGNVREVIQELLKPIIESAKDDPNTEWYPAHLTEVAARVYEELQNK